MKLKIHSQKLGQALLGISALLLILHLLVLFGIVPPQIIWDTTITDKASIAISEAIAIFFLAVFVTGILAKLKHPAFKLFYRLSDSFLWIMVVYFLLNVIGDLMSDSAVEKLLYAPLTLIFSVLVILFILAPTPPTEKRRQRKKSAARRSKRSTR